MPATTITPTPTHPTPTRTLDIGRTAPPTATAATRLGASNTPAEHGTTSPPAAWLLVACVHLLVVADRAIDRSARRLRGRGDHGQATTEYALVLLAAALVGLLVVAWATAGGGAARISRLFNRVVDSVIERV